jgi:hypothetical protein
MTFFSYWQVLTVCSLLPHLLCYKSLLSRGSQKGNPPLLTSERKIPVPSYITSHIGVPKIRVNPKWRRRRRRGRRKGRRRDSFKFLFLFPQTTDCL